jgi:hypothetical protein
VACSLISPAALMENVHIIEQISQTKTWTFCVTVEKGPLALRLD